MEHYPDGLKEGVSPGYRRLEIDPPTEDDVLDFYRDYREQGGEPIQPFERVLKEIEKGAGDGEAA